MRSDWILCRHEGVDADADKYRSSCNHLTSPAVDARELWIDTIYFRDGVI